MQFNRTSIINLRNNFSSIPKTPGVYRWWFPQPLAKELLSSLQGVDNGKIAKETIDGREYWCLYFGISKDLRQRIKWHTTQKHTPSAVKSGFLSTLRQTISAVLGIAESQSEDEVNKVMDQCYWDWCATSTHDKAKHVETQALANGYYPLNVQENKGVDAEVVRQLKELRHKYKN